jgi:hypothetical protein
LVESKPGFWIPWGAAHIDVRNPTWLFSPELPQILHTIFSTQKEHTSEETNHFPSTYLVFPTYCLQFTPNGF